MVVELRAPNGRRPVVAEVRVGGLATAYGDGPAPVRRRTEAPAGLETFGDRVRTGAQASDRIGAGRVCDRRGGRRRSARVDGPTGKARVVRVLVAVGIH